MVTEKNYYDILGVKQNASADEIKKAFKKLARKHHPDTGGDEAKFKEVSEAYDTLSDRQRREDYDTMLRYGAFTGGMGGAGRGAAGAAGRGAGFGGGVGGGQGGWRTVINNVDLGNLGGIGDIFSRMAHGEGAFGTGWDFNGAQTQRAQKGREVHVTLEVSFEEAFVGAEKRVTIRIEGGGEQVIDVKVPAGAVPGGKLRYKGKGSPGVDGGEAGDLVIATEIKPHSLYARKGANVLIDLPISVAEATLGASIMVPAPDGSRVKLRIPADTKDGKTFVIKSKGAPRVKGEGFGELRVQAHLTLPAKLNEGQKAALEAFAVASDPSGFDIRPAIAKAIGASSVSVNAAPADGAPSVGSAAPTGGPASSDPSVGSAAPADGAAVMTDEGEAS
ncbi:MAG: J domain-containing protein [Coriobacteriales bacterium]|jgi:curved DNA-binding protein|nr:J domain-containing protein [Coriobacteriales bacterium]